MRLRDIIYALETGELSNLTLVDQETGLFKPQHYGKIVTSVNLAISDLHTRFMISKGTAEITLVEGQVVYPLTQRFVKTVPEKPEQFLTTGDNLKDLLRILEVRDAWGHDLPLNSGDPRKGINTSSFNTLLISTELYKMYDHRKLFVDYQKTGRLIPTCDTDYDPDCIDIGLDARYLNAIVLFVASRLHNPSGFSTEGVHEGNNYHTLYLEECARLQNTGQFISEQGHGAVRRQGFP